MYLQYLAAWSPFFLIPAAMFGFAAGERVFAVRAAVQGGAGLFGSGCVLGLGFMVRV